MSEYIDSWRDNPTVRNPVCAREDVQFHETNELVDGTPVGQLGASWYVLDDNGNAISEGYHSIRVSGKGLVGKKGATTEPVVYHD